MNKIGINLWNYIKAYSDSDITLIKTIAEIGFTAVEIPMVNTDFSAEKLASEIKKYNLELTQCAAMSCGRDLSNFDASVRRNTEDYLKKCVDIGAVLGSNLICGPLYAGGGKAHYLTGEAKAQELSFAAEGIRKVAEYALESNIKLAIEPINRYRTSVVNTVSQALELIKNVNMPNVGLLYDTYQANIEEADIVASFEDALKSGKLFHLHACDSNRGVPGMGHVPFDELFKLIKKYNYINHITMETFTPQSLDAVWEYMAPTQDILASTGLINIKKLIERNQ